jgi:hypothetical protein
MRPFSSRTKKQILTRLVGLFSAIAPLCSSLWGAAGGSCPAGANYVNAANEGQYRTMRATLSSLGVVSCYYVGLNGLDSNSGTSESSPFLHIPGTPNFKGKAILGPGVGVIVEGGYVAHLGAATSPGTGGVLTISRGGAAGRPLYYGIDPTWHAGDSFSRPVLSGDNPLSTKFVSSCAHDNATLQEFVRILPSASYIMLDGFESTGICWESAGVNVIYTTTVSQYVYLERWYHHGWTSVSTSEDSAYLWWDGGTTADGDILALNVVDGADSSSGSKGSTNCHWNSTNPCYSGGAIYEGANIVWGNVFQHLSNVAVTTNTVKWHDNYVNDLSNSYQDQGQHLNCNNEVNNVAGAHNYFYNNLTTGVNATECYYLSISSGNALYAFNNVFWGNMNYLADKAPANCVFLNAISPSGTQTVYWYNNTMDYAGGNGGGCVLQFAPKNLPLYAFSGVAYIENTHAIGYRVFSELYIVAPGAMAAVHDNGGEVYQTETAAAVQGHTTSNNYAPTSSEGVTRHAGNNLTSFCSSIPDEFAAMACASGTSGSVTEASGWGGKVVIFPAIAVNPRGAAWDTGAYQFQSPGQL